MATAERGIELLAKHVDTLIVIPNQNLFRVANEKTTFAAAFAMADQVLYSGVASITELMTKEGLINLDFADVRAIMSEMGKAMMGTGEATGDKRAIEAAEAAISNPLLDDVSMRGARGLLISITGGPDLTLYEVDEAATRIREEVDPEANIILGATFDESLEGTMRVSVVATGLPVEMSASQQEDLEEEPAEEPQASRQVFGFTGKQPPAKKPVQPAPMAARVAPRLAGETANADQPMARQQQRSHRMPAIEDFPPIAQKQIAARQNRIEHIAEHSARRKKGLFERLAGVGLGRKEEEAIAAPKEPSIGVQQVPRSQMSHSPRSQPQPQPQTMHIDPGLDDDQLEIPAFLRRQAN
jgi:cell division protein FtsZ